MLQIISIELVELINSHEKLGETIRVDGITYNGVKFYHRQDKLI